MYKKILFLFICFNLFLPSLSFSAQSYFYTKEERYSNGQDFVVEVLVNSENQSINAIEGSISFPSDFLEVQDISISNSALNFWVDKPKPTSDGIISFSGITPSGITGENIELFKIIFKPKNLNKNFISYKDIKIFANDGLGSAVSVKSSNILIEIVDGASTKDSVSSSILDTTPPDDFRPDIGMDPSIFGGKYFIVFSAQDKGSGIDRYEIKEGFFDDFVKAESPYVLKNQNLDKKIYIKAFDKDDNYRLVKYTPQNFKPFYLDKFILGIMLFSFILFSFLIKSLWLKSIR